MQHDRVTANEFEVVVLTEAMIANGYLDLPIRAKTLFPDDCFGTRQTGDEGRPIELRYGSEVALTDIRIKSGETISPRRRFGAWFKSLQAAPGDHVRLAKTADRIYELSFVRK